MLVNLGVSYKRAPLSTLDSLTLRGSSEFYEILKRLTGVRGCVLLQTCNRVELFLDTENPTGIPGKVLRHWALETRFKLGDLSRIVETREGDQVIEHLIRLGSGLESMLLGEPQILGQLRQAVAESQSHNATTPTLTKLFDRAIPAASKVRQETGIGKGSVGLGSAMVKLVEAVIGPMRDKRVLLIGTGQVGMISMKALTSHKVARVMVAGRTRQRTDSFCRSYGGTPIDLRQVRDSLGVVDLVLVATKSTNHVLTKEMVSATLSGRQSRLMVVDLASPRNVSSGVQELEGVILKTLEDLRNVTEEAITRRRELVSQAEPLVRQKAADVSRLLRREYADPFVSSIYQRADMIRVEELEKAISRLTLSSDEREVLENMSKSLVEKILEPTALNLRKAAEKNDKQVLTAAGQIFGSE